MVWGAVAAAGIGAASSMMASAQSNKAARQLQRMQIKWERERAQNAHQWEMADLKKAGLNPALTATGGSGASTSGISGAMPDTSGMQNAGNIIANSAKMIADKQNVESQTDLNEAQRDNVNADTTQKTITNSNLDKSQKAEIKNKEAQTRSMNVDTRYQEASFNHRLTQQMAETEKSVSEGRISINAAKFLETYGITRQEALTLGVEGVRQIMGMIREGLSNWQVHRQAKEILKLKQSMKGGAGFKR